MDINNFIIEYWKNIESQNEMELKDYFHEDAFICWHNTNEQFNVSEFLQANCQMQKISRSQRSGINIFSSADLRLKFLVFFLIFHLTTAGFESFQSLSFRWYQLNAHL